MNDRSDLLPGFLEDVISNALAIAFPVGILNCYSRFFTTREQIPRLLVIFVIFVVGVIVMSMTVTFVIVPALVQRSQGRDAITRRLSGYSGAG